MSLRKMNIAIVGIFYDGYYDLWEDFLELKEKFWKDCPYPLYIVNQTKDLDFEKKYDVTVIHAGADAEYSRKVQTAIKEIEADYYLLLLDDFFFSKKLEARVLDKIIVFMEENNLSYYGMPMGEFAKAPHSSRFNGMRNVYNITHKDEYTVSCQPSIWKKDFLIKCIGKGNYNAWVFEGIYIKSKDAHKEEFLAKCKLDTSNFLHILHGALQGKMMPNTVRAYQNIGYTLKTTRPVLSRKVQIVHNYKAKLLTLIPIWDQKMMRKVLHRSSVIDKYEQEIISEMQIMNIR